MIITQYDESKVKDLKECVTQVLTTVGEDLNREGLINTPERVAKCILQFTSGYSVDPIAVLNSAKFKEDYSKPVLIKDIEFYSLCEHHMLPFFGKVHIAYIPDGSIVGLSKIPRIVDILSHRLQVQERFTREICQCIQQALQPKGVMVVVEAQHMCMQMRGVEKQGATTVTSDYSGDFSSSQMREEFYKQIGK
ncbi:MAG: GTP cyclohydrolase I FolE [Bacteroidaceae bacterium]|nr:GTP cyclohydrolase I FolE [Bacteroidaceae bacterium]MBR4590711.1 GTP cyclohydrolase I FolE [Bacteroidaceae bacterium]MCR4770505.1 GTP cyclohydrolase I FolE [Bacteroidaceae bacterium]